MKQWIKNHKRWLFAISGVLIIGSCTLLLILFQDKIPPLNHQVTFMVDTQVIQVQSVKDGKSAEPPANVKLDDGLVFAHWDKPLSNIIDDTVIRAVYIDARDLENAFTVPSAYCKKDGLVTVPLELQGRVELSGFDIRIRYDKTALTFVEFANLDEDVIANCVADEGLLYFNFVSNQNIQGGFYIGGLVFEAHGNENDICKVEFVYNDVVHNVDDDILEAQSNPTSGTINVY
jgi:hypothetical protein